MPWTAPKSLTTDEVYAVLAYMLNLGSIVPDDLVLSNANIEQVQKLLPNRKGMTTDHGMWPGKLIGNGGKPDVKAIACMKDCDVGVTIKSSLPDFARNAHGNWPSRTDGGCATWRDTINANFIQSRATANIKYATA
jgi:cytochrome c